uniref:uncharacterized protein LOC120326965 n=1 Tax=Styela clava TaxID=7725 RepID=UPI0019399BB9|nr:uncharacterized protein LOC120326965 [Styela clava]
MRSLVYVQLFLVSMQFLTRVNYAHRQKCEYRPTRNDIQWEKLAGKTFYNSLNDGDAVSDDVACVKVHNITKVDDGVKATLDKYLFSSPDKPDVIRLHAQKNGPGFYMLDKNTDSAIMRDVINEHGGINEKAVIENIKVSQSDAEFHVTDYENYFIIVRCSDEGRWYVQPHTSGSVPTAEDVLRIWRALYENGINQPLFMSHCSEVL